MNCDLCRKEIKTGRDLRFILKSLPEDLNYKNATFFYVHNDCYSGLVEFFSEATILDESLEMPFMKFVKGVFETDELLV